MTNTTNAVASAVANQKIEVSSSLQNAFAELITKTTTGLEKGADFLAGQIPDVIHQLLVYKMVESVISSILFVIGAFILYKCTNALFQKAEQVKDRYNNFDYRGAAYVLCGASIGFCVKVYLSLKTILLIWLAPKVYLIQYASELLSGK